MKGTSKVIMGTTLVMVVTLAIVIALILVLLAELYCSLLLRRRRHHKNTTQTTTTTLPTTSPTHPPQHSPSPSPPPPPPPPFYAPGVLQAPRTFLYPCMEQQDIEKDSKKHNHCELLQKVIVHDHISSPQLSLSSFMSRLPPPPHDDNEREELVYISNPIYENDEEEGKEKSGVLLINNTPFETPDTSPSRLEKSDGDGDSSEDDNVVVGVVCADSPPVITYTPPLTPMKKLPTKACSVSLRDARSLGTSCSDSRSVNNGPSSSSSCSPSTSPSW